MDKTPHCERSEWLCLSQEVLSMNGHGNETRTARVYSGHYSVHPNSELLGGAQSLDQSLVFRFVVGGFGSHPIKSAEDLFPLSAVQPTPKRKRTNG